MRENTKGLVTNYNTAEMYPNIKKTHAYFLLVAICSCINNSCVDTIWRTINNVLSDVVETETDSHWQGQEEINLSR